MTLRAGRDGYETQRRAVTLTSNITIDFLLVPATTPPAGGELTGTVTARPIGEAVRDAEVHLLRGGIVQFTAWTNSAGAYRIGGIPFERYVLRTVKMGYHAADQDLALAADARVDIVVERNRVTFAGFVSEAPPCYLGIEGARVEVVDGPDAGKAVLASANSGYRLETIAWGTFRLRASRAGYASNEVTETVPPPAAIEGTVISEHFRLQGQVGRFVLFGDVWNQMMETAGQVNDALIQVTGGPNTGRTAASGQAGRGDGIYELRDLIPGALQMVVSKPGFVTEPYEPSWSAPTGTTTCGSPRSTRG